MMKYFSMFSGIGGFELGMQRAVPKLQCVGFSEIDKFAIQNYKEHFPEHKEAGDATEINWRKIEDFDILVGGFPCQAFSIAGKRGGFADTRGTMFFQIVKALRERRPRLLVLENVRGLLSHDKGFTFATMLSALDELGYDAEWQVLNTKDFGLAQNRDRVFIIGYHRSHKNHPTQVFPITRKSRQSLIEVGTLDMKALDCIKRVFCFQGISPTITTSLGGYRFGKFWDGETIRKLTPVECERAQGFPDNWTESITAEVQRYKCLGNAVAPPVVEAVFKAIKGAKLI